MLQHTLQLILAQNKKIMKKADSSIESAQLVDKVPN